MSINSELTRLDEVRDALVSSVNGKGGSLAADATLWQVKQAVDGIEVGGGEDPTPIVTQPAPEVSIDKATGKVTAAYTPVAGKVTDTSKKSATFQLTVQGAQTITPGKTSQTVPADRYLTGVQTIAGDNNLSAENIKNGVSIFGVSGSYTGDAVEVTQPKPTVSVNSSNGLVTAKYTPVAGLVKDTAEKSGTLQLTAQAAQTITPGTSDKTIAAGRYLTGTQTIKGDTNLTAGNIKKGVSIFNIAGEYEGEGGGGGGGGAFDLVKVTEYQPYQAAFAGVSKVTFSGFGYDDMTGEDFSVLNGEFAAENPGEPDPLKRTFKKGEYYLYFYPDPDYRVGGDAWCLSKNKTSGGYDAWLFYNSSTELTSGSTNWSNMMGGATTQCTVTKASYPEVQFSMKAQKAIAYDTESSMFVISRNEISPTGCTGSPSVGWLYASYANTVIGEHSVAGEGEQAIPTGFTSNTSIAGYVIKQSHGAGSYPDAWVVFNLNYTSGDYAWYSGGIGVSQSNPCWFSIQVPEAFCPSAIFIMNEVTTPENFKNAKFQGSNNGTTWDDLLIITNSPNTTGLQQTFAVNTENTYTHFRMYFTASHASGVSIQAFTIYRSVFRYE